MERQATIEVVLMDNGDPGKRIKCKIANKTALVFKIPRSMLNECKDIKELKYTGTYLLFGYDDELSRDLVYVGQADLRENGQGLIARILDHTKSNSENYWNEVVAITTVDNSYTSTDINYLEYYLYKEALNANRCKTVNKKEPYYGNQGQNIKDKIEEFVDYVKVLVGMLGYKVFEPYKTIKNPDNKTEQEFICAKKDGSAKGIGILTTECGILLKKGSIISPTEVDSCLEHVRKRRKEEKNKIVDNELTEDIYFEKPSTAANFVLGNNVNGWIKWVTNDDRHLTLKEVVDGDENVTI